MRYDRKEDRIELSVRELCALACKGGSLDTRLPPLSLYRRAEEGRTVHTALRTARERGEGLTTAIPAVPSAAEYEDVRPSDPTADPPTSKAAYYPEVTLRHTARCEEITFHVTGRADGVWYDPLGGCIVEELKSLPTSTSRFLRAPREADLAQLTCYGYFIAAAKGLTTVTLRLTYAHPGREEEAAHTDSTLTVEQLKAAYVALLRLILPAARDLRSRETDVRNAARTARFPYRTVRPAQEEMIRECYRDMRAGKILFAEAPTGIGKTIATLYPAIRCLGEGRCDKIFYLTAKNATRREAVGAVEKLIAAGPPIRACVITARESACLHESAKRSGRRLSSFCNPQACPQAKGYYDRIDGVIEALLAKGGVFTEAVIHEAAVRGGVCPYELSLDLSERCEVIICDYNYVFSPAVYLRRYFADGLPGTDGHRYIFLVDETHNLPDRVRDMYSASLSLSELHAAQDSLRAFETQISRTMIFPEEDLDEDDTVEPDDTATARPPRLTSAMLDDVVGPLSRLSDLCAETMTTDAQGVRRGYSLDRVLPIALCEGVEKLAAACDRWLRRNDEHPMAPVADELSGMLKAFRTAAAYFDHRFTVFTEVEGEDVCIRLSCLDPAGVLRPILGRAVASVLFSATLTPAAYYADILGGDRSSVLVNFDSPFPPEHLCVAVCPTVSTRFEDRDNYYRTVVAHIAATVAARRGHYLLYFPSYHYLEKVYAMFEKRYPKIKTVIQKPGMSYAEREAFLAAFTEEDERLLLGFCVLSGSFSEGIDLPGKRLIGTVIVGVGIPGLSVERNIMRDYFDTRPDSEGDGYAYAYTYPGLNHVLQAAGRVIRRDTDRGVVVLLDDRYAEPLYASLLPAHWDRCETLSDAAELNDYLRAFWDEEGG